MATVSKKICDRCGADMKYVGWTAMLKNVFKRGSRIRVLKLLNGNPDGYSYAEHECELCAECTKKLEDFLSRKGETHEPKA